jgi:hypothetical protein
MKISPLKPLILPAVILRLIFSALFFHPDIKSQNFHAQFLSRGVIDIYGFIDQNRPRLPYTDTFNYPPLAYYFLGSWNFITGRILGPGFYSWLNDWGPGGYSSPRMFEFMLVLKLPYVLLDFLIALLLLKLSADNRRLLALWLFNPLSLYAVYMLGQFDILPAALTVMALVLIRDRRPVAAALLLGLGAALKTYPLLLLPFVLIRTGTIKQFFNAALIGLLGFIVPLLPVINSAAFRYTMTHSNLMQGIFYAHIEVSSGQSIPLYVLIWVIVFWISWIRRNNYDLLPEFLTLTLTVILISHFHAQWLVWSLPFLILLTVKNIRLWPVLTAVAVGYFGTVWLIPDQFVLLGLFSPINSQALIFPPLYDLVKTVIQPEFLQSLFHTLLAASGFWLMLTAFKSYENK